MRELGAAILPGYLSLKGIHRRGASPSLDKLIIGEGAVNMPIQLSYLSLKGIHRRGASPDLGKLIEWEFGAVNLPGYLSLKDIHKNSASPNLGKLIEWEIGAVNPFPGHNIHGVRFS